MTAPHGAAAEQDGASCAATGELLMGHGVRRTLVWVPAVLLFLLTVKWVLITAILLAGSAAVSWSVYRVARSRRWRLVAV